MEISGRVGELELAWKASGRRGWAPCGSGNGSGSLKAKVQSSEPTPCIRARARVRARARRKTSTSTLTATGSTLCQPRRQALSSSVHRTLTLQLTLPLSKFQSLNFSTWILTPTSTSIGRAAQLAVETSQVTSLRACPMSNVQCPMARGERGRGAWTFGLRR